MTVYKYLRHESWASPVEPVIPSVRWTLPPYLSQRWQDGCHNATQLWRELKERGYPGTDRMVLVWAHQQRQTPAPSTPSRYRSHF